MIKRGTLCTILGLLLLLAALLLTAYNLRRDAAAGDAAELVLERLTPDLPSTLLIFFMEYGQFPDKLCILKNMSLKYLVYKKYFFYIKFIIKK